MTNSPRLMSGVPTGYLTPIVPAPKPLVPTVGVEIEPGLGISLDGNALLIGHKQAEESFQIRGHLEYDLPLRNFDIHRQGHQTQVDGYYEHQDYRLEQQGTLLRVHGETPLESFQTLYRKDGFEVQSAYSNRSYRVNIQGSRASVTSGSGDGVRYQITQQGNQTRVKASQGGGYLLIDRHSDGSIIVDGPLATQDFRLTPQAQGHGWLLEGFYPHQTYKIG